MNQGVIAGPLVEWLPPEKSRWQPGNPCLFGIHQLLLSGAEYVRGPLQPTWAAQLADARRMLLGKGNGFDVIRFRLVAVVVFFMTHLGVLDISVKHATVSNDF